MAVTHYDPAHRQENEQKIAALSQNIDNGAEVKKSKIVVPNENISTDFIELIRSSIQSNIGTDTDIDVLSYDTSISSERSLETGVVVVKIPSDIGRPVTYRVDETVGIF